MALDSSLAKLVGDDSARDCPRRSGAGERAAGTPRAAAEAVGDDRTLGCLQVRRREPHVALEHEPGEERRVRDLAVAGDAGQARDLRRCGSDPRASCTGRRPGRMSWPGRERPVEPGPRHARAAAEAVVPRPEIDAGRRRLVRVAVGLRAHSPQPHDQTVSKGISRRTCLIASTWSLMWLNQALAGFRPSRPPWPGFVWKPRKMPIFEGGIPISVRSVTPWRNALRRSREPSIGPCAVDLGRREVDLADEVGVERRLPPPVAGLAVRERAGREQQEWMRAERTQAPDEDDDVLPVLRVRRRPGRGEVRAPHLVERDPRRRAGRGRDRAVEDAVGPVLDDGRIQRVRRRADPLAEVHLPVDGLRAERADLRRVDEVRCGGHDSGPREHRPVRHRPVCEVDPERASVGRPHSRACACAGRNREQRGAAGEDDEKPLQDGQKASGRLVRGSHCALV